MKQFLNACQLPTLSESDQNSLGMEITEGDIRKTINSLKNGKSPGPDGICNEFYEKFGNTISTFLLRMYKKSLEDGKLPSTLNEATITLIPKKGKDLDQVGSYRPVSLLNSDLKILAKTLASRLSPLVTKLIHPDQTGFIPDRHLFHNVRRLLNILYSPRQPKEDLFILSLDAQKAFDCVELPYLYAVLEKFGLGTGFISWIKLLYSNPSARVLTNQTMSGIINLYRGTRQGCPLSPLLFALALEPLAATIRTNKEIHGYDTDYTSNKILLYADDNLNLYYRTTNFNACSVGDN